MKIKILLVDDHAIVRCGIRSLIERNENLTVCGEAENLKEAYRMVIDLKPDIVLLDIKLPDGDGITGCREMLKLNSEIKIIILTAYAEDHIVIEAIKAGAGGYLLKNVESSRIIKAIIEVYNGAAYLDPSVTEGILKELKGKKEDISNLLTPRDVEILELISVGKTNKEIGEILFIAEKTVRNYVSKIMQKIGVNNRTEAAIFWNKQKSLK
ncbi:response regulator [Alkaliphilus peptidifermentans]|uniref:Stage 0 sporulation protein A homolog n=1 Tax=Alkaliphilus peptidifermentans DSM 18978 TaxID=1120976 RepID=A0A1G5K0U2_9FIRM|nr:response regulator transcription factor [Alkaliphilus peptidifermentans]SCY93608.1 two component transcriptional regulator, LuxR family [Alkaliphilus peptidifermentans DSM 18978]